MDEDVAPAEKLDSARPPLNKTLASNGRSDHRIGGLGSVHLQMKPSNILRIDTLDNEWRDKDSVMLHACFQLLKDCVEKENLLDGDTDWDADEMHRLAKQEIDELYNWWLSYLEPDIPTGKHYAIENAMLIRLVKIRWAMWS